VGRGVGLRSFLGLSFLGERDLDFGFGERLSFRGGGDGLGDRLLGDRDGLFTRGERALRGGRPPSRSLSAALSEGCGFGDRDPSFGLIALGLVLTFSVALASLSLTPPRRGGDPEEEDEEELLDPEEDEPEEEDDDDELEDELEELDARLLRSSVLFGRAIFL